MTMASTSASAFGAAPMEVQRLVNVYGGGVSRRQITSGAQVSSKLKKHYVSISVQFISPRSRLWDSQHAGADTSAVTSQTHQANDEDTFAALQSYNDRIRNLSQQVLLECGNLEDAHPTEISDMKHQDVSNEIK